MALMTIVLQSVSFHIPLLYAKFLLSKIDDTLRLSEEGSKTLFFFNFINNQQFRVEKFYKRSIISSNPFT